MKTLILILLLAITFVSCQKTDVTISQQPVMLKVQAVNQDNTVVESNILFIK